MDLVKRAEEELEYLYSELPPVGEEGREIYIDEIEKWQKIREEAIKCEEPKKENKWLTYLDAGLKIISVVAIPLYEIFNYNRLVVQGYEYEKEGIISSPTFKDVIRERGGLFRFRKR